MSHAHGASNRLESAKTDNLAECRKAICAVGRRLYRRGLVAGHDGNISLRWTDSEILCTPTRISKGRLRPRDLCLIDLQGERLAGTGAPSSEIKMHLAIYRARVDVQAIVHAHPPHALAFAVTHREIPLGILPEVEIALGHVPLVPYATPGTQQLGDVIVPFLTDTRALILANHGTVSFATSLEVALWYTEILEQYCQVLLFSKSLGPVVPLTAEQLDALGRG